MAGKCIEIVFLTIALVAGIGAGVAGGFTVGKLLALSDIEIGIAPFSEPLETFVLRRDPNLLPYTRASAGLAISVAGLGIVLAFTALLRVCCCKSGSGAGAVILCVDLLLMLACAIGFGAGGVLGSTAAATWTNSYLSEPAVTSLFTIFQEMRDVVAATAGTCLFACVAYITLILATLINCARNHNDGTTV